MTDSVVVSIVTFNGKEFIARCLEAVLAQTYPLINICVLDNASQDGTPEFVSEAFPTVNVICSGNNIGFAAGHNRVICQTQSAFVLVLNQDAFLSPTFVEELIHAMTEHLDVGIAGGKLYSARNSTPSGATEQLIDMTWLDIEKKRRQVCYVQLQRDEGQAAYPTLAFALDGAAMLLRRSMLADIQIEGEFFDEDFFAGKEDLDISWRAQLLGWKCLYVPSAIGYHLRTFTPKDKRAKISDTLRVSSIRNRYLLIVKNDLLLHFLQHFVHIFLYDIKIMAYVLLYERSSVKGYLQFFHLLPKALRKRRLIMQRRKADSSYILGWFR